MSILFFDNQFKFQKLEKRIKMHARSADERYEFWQVVEEIIHHRVIGCCLSNLPVDHHHQFLEMFCDRPYDKKILTFLNEKSKKDMKKIIKEEIKNLTKDLLLLGSDKV